MPKNKPQFSIGQEVLVKATVAGERMLHKPTGVVKVYVEFSDGSSNYVPESDLIPINPQPESEIKFGAYPGQYKPWLSQDNRWVVLSTYHAGNIRQVIKALHELGVPLHTGDWWHEVLVYIPELQANGTLGSYKKIISDHFTKPHPPEEPKPQPELPEKIVRTTVFNECGMDVLQDLNPLEEKINQIIDYLRCKEGR